MDEMMTLASTYIWRCSKGIYRFAPEIFSALTAQPLASDLPTNILYLLPEWTVYTKTPGLTYERHQMEGFIAHLDYNLFSRNVALQFAMLLQGREMPKMVALPLGAGRYPTPWTGSIRRMTCSWGIRSRSGISAAVTSTGAPFPPCSS